MRENQKSNNKKPNKDNKKIMRKAIIICSALILILLFLIMLLVNSNKKTDQIADEPVKQEERENKVANFVRTKGERERVEVYIGEFIKHIERKEYTAAYNKLHPDFRERYFKTEQDFIKYANAHYSSLMSVTYNDIQRQGNYYIMEVTIKDLEVTKLETTQIYIIHETGINEYYISFQVQF